MRVPRTLSLYSPCPWGTSNTIDDRDGVASISYLRNFLVGKIVLVVFQRKGGYEYASNESSGRYKTSPYIH
jgi:hypothetical protein